MDKVFPGAQFEIRIQDDEVLSRSPYVIIRIEYKCPCYVFRPPQVSEFIRVRKTAREPIMISDAISAMIEHGVNPDCKHFTLDGFKKDTDIQFTAVFGL